MEQEKEELKFHKQELIEKLSKSKEENERVCG